MSERIGYTARLDTLQAAVLLRKLPLLDEWNRQRREAAALYADALAGRRRPPLPAGALRAAGRCGTCTRCAPRAPRSLRRSWPSAASTRGATTRSLPTSHPPIAALGHRRGAFPVAERLAAELLSLPIFPGISELQVARVADAVHEYFRHGV